MVLGSSKLRQYSNKEILPTGSESGHCDNPKPIHKTKDEQVLKHSPDRKSKDVTKMSDNCLSKSDGEMFHSGFRI